MDDFGVRLSDGQYDRGRVEVSVGGVWGSVATSSGWTSGNNARVVCASLGFETYVYRTHTNYNTMLRQFFELMTCYRLKHGLLILVEVENTGTAQFDSVSRRKIKHELEKK
jgi:hypothetical protein